MTTIGSTARYAPAAPYVGADTPKAGNGGSATFELTEHQERKTATGTARSSGPSDAQTAAAPPTPGTTIEFRGTQVTIQTFESSEIKGTPTWQNPGEFHQGLISGLQLALEADYRQFPEMPDLSNYPAIKPYATVMVGGQVVAKLDNQGGVQTDNDLDPRLRAILASDVNGKGGPDLAQARAEQIAQYFGGRVETADTAITQRQFDALPPLPSSKPTVDYDAMKADPRYTQLQGMMQKMTDYRTEQQTKTDINL